MLKPKNSLGWIFIELVQRLKLIETKSVILMGGTYEQRQDRIKQVREQFLRKFPNSSVFTLSEHIGDSRRYLKSVLREFPIKPFSKDQKKEDLSIDDIDDRYLDWAADFKSVLVILPEFDKLYRAQQGYFYETVGNFLAHQHYLPKGKSLRFVMTLAKKTAIDIAAIPVLVGGAWRPSTRDVEVLTVGA